MSNKYFLSQKKWREEHKEYISSEKRKYYENNKEAIKEKACLRYKAMGFSDRTSYQRAMYAKHREKRLTSKKRYLREMREMLFRHYGDKCSCCGEAEKIFLTLEHVNNDGALHRKQVRSMNPVALILDLRKRGWPDKGYTILCFNCNLGKAKNKNVCPHVENKVLEVLQGGK